MEVKNLKLIDLFLYSLRCCKKKDKSIYINKIGIKIICLLRIDLFAKRADCIVYNLSGGKLYCCIKTNIRSFLTYNYKFD